MVCSCKWQIMFSQETSHLTLAALTRLCTSEHTATKRCLIGYWAFLLFNKSTCSDLRGAMSVRISLSLYYTGMDLSQIKQSKLIQGVLRFSSSNHFSRTLHFFCSFFVFFLRSSHAFILTNNLLYLFELTV